MSLGEEEEKKKRRREKKRRRGEEEKKRREKKRRNTESDGTSFEGSGRGEKVDHSGIKVTETCRRRDLEVKSELFWRG